MCCGATTEAIQDSPLLHSALCKKQRRHVRPKVQVQRLNWRRCEGKSKDMEMKNLKLYLQNRSIQEENEKLRKKALVLRRENEALMSQFQKKFSSPPQGS
ncbi:hypothetical protein Dimus_008846 [Dionaea muscipula]